MASSSIKSVINKIPYLTNFGVGIYDHSRRLSREQYLLKIAEGQKELIESVDEFNKTCDWLNGINKIKSINDRHSSYGLKHIAEKSIGCYISNGVFIAAAIHMGFDYKIIKGGPNVSFNMSEKSINKAQKI